jgi:hypothetical protein
MSASAAPAARQSSASPAGKPTPPLAQGTPEGLSDPAPVAEVEPEGDKLAMPKRRSNRFRKWKALVARV